MKYFLYILKKADDLNFQINLNSYLLNIKFFKFFFHENQMEVNNNFYLIICEIIKIIKEKIALNFKEKWKKNKN